MRIEEIIGSMKTVVAQKKEYQTKKRETLLLNLRGVVSMSIAAILWGVSGNIVKILLQSHNITPQWLAAFRTLVVGIVLYVLLRPPFPRKHVFLFFYAVIGLIGSQIFFYLAIAHASAPIATLLEFLSIPLIALYETIVNKQHLSKTKFYVIILAIIGTILLSFGDVHGLQLVIDPLGLIFGLLVAIAVAMYALMGVPLVREYGSWNVTAWSFFVGGIALSCWIPPWNVHPTGNITITILLILFVITFGTLIAYGLSMSSLKVLSASEAKIIGLLEPLTSALGGILLLHEFMTPLQYLGGVILLAAIVILQIFDKKLQN